MKVTVQSNEIHKAVWDWLYNGDNGISELSFISAQYDENGEIMSDNRVVIVPGEIGETEELYKDITGLTHKKYDFMLKQFVVLSTQSNTPVNINELANFENLIEWIKKEIEKGNEPDFPDNFDVQEFKIGKGYIAGVDAEGAELQLTINIFYDEIEKEN